MNCKAGAERCSTNLDVGAEQVIDVEGGTCCCHCRGSAVIGNEGVAIVIPGQALSVQVAVLLGSGRPCVWSSVRKVGAAPVCVRLCDISRLVGALGRGDAR